MKTTHDTTIRNLFAGFLLSCQTEGKSQRTIDWYTDMVGRFFNFLEKRGFPLDSRSVTKQHIQAYILHLQQEVVNSNNGDSLSPYTIQGYVRALRVFFAWMYREEYIEVNPAAKIPAPKVPIKVIPTFTDGHVSALLRECRDSNGLSQRNTTIILLQLDCGLRVSELVNLEVADVNLEEGHLIIQRGKGGKGRYVPYGSLVQKALWKYIQFSRPQPCTKQVQKVFLSKDGIPLTRNGIQTHPVAGRPVGAGLAYYIGHFQLRRQIKRYHHWP